MQLYCSSKPLRSFITCLVKTIRSLYLIINLSHIFFLHHSSSFLLIFLCFLVEKVLIFAYSFHLLHPSFHFNSLPSLPSSSFSSSPFIILYFFFLLLLSAVSRYNGEHSKWKICQNVEKFTGEGRGHTGL